ncbi:hypothetical protein C9J85_10545 [Haloferax sp. wsp5]|nr:hypothetical protein C9J85_10545 [Haloferax sp. wsp5]
MLSTLTYLQFHALFVVPAVARPRGRTPPREPLVTREDSIRTGLPRARAVGGASSGAASADGDGAHSVGSGRYPSASTSFSSCRRRWWGCGWPGFG